VLTPVLEEDVRPAPGGSSTTGLHSPTPTRTSDPRSRPLGPENPAPSPATPAAPLPESEPARRRYHEVDLLRFLAAIAVVGFHYLFRASVEDPAFALTGFTDPGGIFRYGYLGVDLFFVISGFVILNSAWKKRPSAFVASRIARLYPAFWMACTITAVVLLLDPNQRFEITAEKYVYNLTMAPKLFDMGLIDGVYWTLLIELKFYLLILVLCVIGMTLNRVLGFAVGWLALSIWDKFAPLPETLDGLLVPEWAPYFAAGILFALVARQGWRKRYAVPLLVAGGWAVYISTELSRKQSDSYHTHLSPYVVGGVVAGIFVLFALIASHKLQARWTARVAFLGGLTYPLYLLHQYIGFVLFNLGYGRMPRWLLLAGVVTIVVALSWLLHVTVEERCAAPLARWLRAKWETVRTVALSTHPIEDVHNRQWSTPSSSVARIY